MGMVRLIWVEWDTKKIIDEYTFPLLNSGNFF